MSDDITPQTDATEPEPIGLAGLAPVETLGQQWPPRRSRWPAAACRRGPGCTPWPRCWDAWPRCRPPTAARFQRVELGAEPLPMAPRVRPSREDAGTEGVGYVAGMEKSSDVAPIEEHTLLAPDVRRATRSGPASVQLPDRCVKAAQEIRCRRSRAAGRPRRRARRGATRSGPASVQLPDRVSPRMGARTEAP